MLNHQISRFAVIGIASTVIYAIVALLLSEGQAGTLSPQTASVVAYAVAAVFSYSGHKYFTFVSGGQHRFEAPRFVVVTLLGLAISFALPALLSGRLGLPALMPIALTCIVIPVVNYVVLNRWVFAPRRDYRS